jgi:hypothetical protein
MIDRWQDLVTPINPAENVTFQIDLFIVSLLLIDEKMNASSYNSCRALEEVFLDRLLTKGILPFMRQGPTPASQIQRLLEELQKSDRM